METNVIQFWNVLFCCFLDNFLSLVFSSLPQFLLFRRWTSWIDYLIFLCFLPFCPLILLPGRCPQVWLPVILFNFKVCAPTNLTSESSSEVVP